jgi:protein-ribulosamine 3-kinase
VDLAGVARELAALTGLAVAPQPQARLRIGSVAQCYAWQAGTQRIFVKLAPSEAAAALAAEALGLAELGATCALKVPLVLARGTLGAAAFLALEWIEAVAPDARCEARLGEGLARMHGHHAARCGYAHDNFIGATPQDNAWMDDWSGFFRERRLRPQLRLAAQRGLAAELGCGERLLEAVPALLAGREALPSLLHGDLWGGNWLAGAGGEPVLIDPAVYYGDREADLAMTRLFGGFGAAFYRAYEVVLPRLPGWQVRADLYNLYHVLNHANLFGGGYVQEARALMERLLAEVRS